MKKFISWFFIIQSLSLLVVGLYQVYLHETPRRLSFAKYPAPVVAAPQNITPSTITIDEVGINVPVIPATMQDTVWPTTDKGASYLTSSPLPGHMGNSIIYGHNWKSVFGNLVKAKVGQKVVVTYPDNTKKTFVIAYTSVVSPNEASILAQSTDKRITLYTCTGFLDSKRFVAVAILQG
jgi:LPXTG-site transpeptidase (sortase) family protein